MVTPSINFRNSAGFKDTHSQNKILQKIWIYEMYKHKSNFNDWKYIF